MPAKNGKQLESMKSVQSGVKDLWKKMNSVISVSGNGNENIR